MASDELAAIVILVAAGASIVLWLAIALFDRWRDYVNQTKHSPTKIEGAKSPEKAGSEPKTEPAEPERTASERGTGESSGGSALKLSNDELVAARLMIQHLITSARNGQQQNKWRAIESGFGARKGNSKAAQRASEIYDQLIVTSYPTLEGERAKAVQVQS